MSGQHAAHHEQQQKERPMDLMDTIAAIKSTQRLHTWLLAYIVVLLTVVALKLFV